MISLNLSGLLEAFSVLAREGPGPRKPLNPRQTGMVDHPTFMQILKTSKTNLLLEVRRVVEGWGSDWTGGLGALRGWKCFSSLSGCRLRMYVCGNPSGCVIRSLHRYFCMFYFHEKKVNNSRGRMAQWLRACLPILTRAKIPALVPAVKQLPHASVSSSGPPQGDLECPGTSAAEASACV